MDSKNTDSAKYYSDRKIDCTDRALTAQHLSQFSKDALVNFIIS